MSELLRWQYMDEIESQTNKAPALMVTMLTVLHMITNNNNDVDAHHRIFVEWKCDILRSDSGKTKLLLFIICHAIPCQTQ